MKEPPTRLCFLLCFVFAYNTSFAVEKQRMCFATPWQKTVLLQMLLFHKGVSRHVIKKYKLMAASALIQDSIRNKNGLHFARRTCFVADTVLDQGASRHKFLATDIPTAKGCSTGLVIEMGRPCNRLCR